MEIVECGVDGDVEGFVGVPIIAGFQVLHRVVVVFQA